MSPEITWHKEAVQLYKGPEEDKLFRVETYLTRGFEIINNLDDKVLPVKKDPRILLVGIGRKSYSVACSYTPFVVSAYLEHLGAKYKMIVVDILGDVINDVRTRENIYVLEADMDEDDLGDPREKEYWGKYLSITRQEDRIVKTPEEGLEIIDTYDSADFHFARGIHAARIPTGFKTKSQTGDISFIKDDIAFADLSYYTPFDYIDCNNVFYQLVISGQMMAIVNLAKSLNPGGILFVNDIGDYVGNPLFAEVGGWLDDEKLQQIGLVKEDFEMTKHEIEDGRYIDRFTRVGTFLRKK